MFGKLMKSNVIISLILLGFCMYIIQLYLHKNINLYIHPRYSLFAVIMCVLSVLILLVDVFTNFKKHIKVGEARFKVQFLDIIVVIVLILAFVLPSKTLSSGAIGRKSTNTPSYEKTTTDTACPGTKPSSIEIWVYEISQYPINCYEEQSIEIVGFVLKNPDSPLPGDMYYLGRVVMSCCVIDARPYALPVKTGKFEKYPDETWLKVSGKLQSTSMNGSTQLVIEPGSVVKVDNPDKPYDYINTPSQTEVQPLQPVQ